ncbi:hypothetical protein GGF37_003413, partial [Kickxella alabastrina]
LVCPNGSGKSIVLKQAALLVFMSHIGSHIPALSMQLGLTSSILVAGISSESLTHKTSAFNSELSTVMTILKAVTANTVVLLDEFGRGTNPADGMGLLCGVLQSLTRRADKMPWIIAATHFQDIRSIPSAQGLWSCMQVRCMDFCETSSGLVFLFKISDKRASQGSHAVACARDAGIPSSVLDCALKYL